MTERYTLSASPEKHQELRRVLEAKDVLGEETFEKFVRLFQKFVVILSDYLAENLDQRTYSQKRRREIGRFSFMLEQQFSGVQYRLSVTDVVSLLTRGRVRGATIMLESGKQAQCKELFETCVDILAEVQRNRKTGIRFDKPTVSGNKPGEESEEEAVKIAAQQAHVLGGPFRPAPLQPYVNEFIRILFRERETVMSIKPL